MRTKPLALLAIGTVALMTPTIAGASVALDDDLAADLGLAAPVACTVCHDAEGTDSDGGDAATGRVGGADTLFEHALETRGFHVDDPSTLAAAIGKMQADDVDSDGDGARDLDELSWGGDPNHADGAAPNTSDEPPSYGCALAAPRPPSPSPSLSTILVCTLALAMYRLRSRRAALSGDRLHRFVLPTRYSVISPLGYRVRGR